MTWMNENIYFLPVLFLPQDWNHLLSSLSQFQLCVNTNLSSSEFVSAVPSLLTSRPTSNDSTDTSVTTLHVRVPLEVTTSSDGDSLKGVGLQTTLRANQLHLGGLYYCGLL